MEFLWSSSRCRLLFIRNRRWNQRNSSEQKNYLIQAAEEADRKGVDIISTSLGYGDFFDDARYNYSYSQMNGTTSFIARGAQIASEKE